MEKIRFLFVGGVAGFLYLVTSNLLDWMSFSSFSSASVARIVAMVATYLGHSYFTFSVKRITLEGVTKFLLARVVVIGISVLITVVCHDYLETSYMTASIVVILATPFLTYPLAKYWIFKNRTAKPVGEPLMTCAKARHPNETTTDGGLM